MMTKAMESGEQKKWRAKKPDLSITEKKKANNGGTWNSVNVVISANVKE